jgi:GLPGLI family protein
MNRNNIFILIIWLKSAMLFSQISNVKINYSIIVDKDDIFEKALERNSSSEFNSQVYLESLKEYKDYDFTLLKNDTITEFFMNTHQNEKVEKNKIFLGVGYHGVIYQNRNTYYKYISHENIFIYENFDRDWEIAAQTKVIDGYKCYLAKSVNQIKWKEKVFNHQVFAWFCPDLPYSIGPMGYGGLPELILELKIRNATFFATKIEMNSAEKVDTVFFNKYKKVPASEYNEKGEQEMIDAIRKLNSRD